MPPSPGSFPRVDERVGRDGHTENLSGDLHRHVLVDGDFRHVLEGIVGNRIGFRMYAPPASVNSRVLPVSLSECLICAPEIESRLAEPYFEADALLGVEDGCN
jgi:hypothetical protein